MCFWCENWILRVEINIYDEFHVFCTIGGTSLKYTSEMYKWNVHVWKQTRLDMYVKLTSCIRGVICVFKCESWQWQHEGYVVSVMCLRCTGDLSCCARHLKRICTFEYNCVVVVREYVRWICISVAHRRDVSFGAKVSPKAVSEQFRLGVLKILEWLPLVAAWGLPC